jgi:RimJ/RimL family protein N-acetyltransferase
MKAEIRYATEADFVAMGLTERPHRIRALAVTAGDDLLGVGGFSFPPGHVVAFVFMRPGAERHAVTLHRAGLMMMAEARRLKLTKVVAEAHKDNPAAERWLARLGFRPRLLHGETVWVWQNDG